MNLVFTIVLQCAVIIKCKYFFSSKSHIKLCYFHPLGSLFVSVPVSEPVYRRGLMLGKRAVRGDKEGAPQYTLAAGKQTQNIDYIIFTDNRKLAAVDVYPTRSKQCTGPQTYALHFICRCAPTICTSVTRFRP